MKRLLAALLFMSVLVAGCSSAKTEPSTVGQLPDTATKAKAGAMVTITVADLLGRTQAGEKPLIIDVREPNEFEAGHIEGAKLMPLGSVEKTVPAAGIAKDQEIVLICRSGNRSAQAYKKLEALGYTNLINIDGGMNEWAKIGPVTR